MTKETMKIENFFRYYNRLSAADRYYLIFKYKRYVWLIDIPHICSTWCEESKESGSKGYYQKWRICASKLPKDRLVKKAICMMSIKEFEAAVKEYSGNRGDYCEKWLCENFGCVPSSTKHNARFDECGDVTKNGLQYQVKFQNASLTNVNVLHKAQADARARKAAAKVA